jgi:prephenate dehydratase
MSPLPCATFDETFDAVSSGKAALAMIPIENSSAGRVADIHHLLPESGLPIVGEHFQKVDHCLLAPRGALLEDIKQIHSHVQALSQCRQFIRKNGLEAVIRADTAGAAAQIAQDGNVTHAAVASGLAGEIYGLDVLLHNIEDNHDNTTRFCLVAKTPVDPKPGTAKLMTTLVFRVRSVPAALYKALGGFATNGVNITKLESYIVDGSFNVAQFYADFEGHPNERPVQLALEELAFFSEQVTMLGTYPASPFRASLP